MRRQSLRDSILGRYSSRNDSNDQSGASSPARSQSVRQSSTSGSNNSNNPYLNSRLPQANPDSFSQLQSPANAPPPPSYETALRSPVSPQEAQRVFQQQSPQQPPIQPTRPVSQPPTSPPQRQNSSGRNSYPPTPQQPQQTSPNQATGSSSNVMGSRPARRNSVEDPLAPLSRYDVCFLVDDSPSMVELWDEVETALEDIVQRSIKYDKDGVDIHFLNADSPSQTGLNCTTTSQVRQLFKGVEPSGSTPTGMRMDDILRPYVERCEDSKNDRSLGKVKPLILIVLTDGRADDQDMVKDVIVEMAQRLDEGRHPPFQLGIQFVQIGDDSDAANFLKELDDDLKSEHGVRDIVDTVPFGGRATTTDMIVKALLGAVNRRIDG